MSTDKKSASQGTKETKYIFITGGVLSSLGKGMAAASIGALLKSRGLSVTIQKLDPYINVDPGTMNPLQHGEVYVTDDGAETDLDLGHYERYLDVPLSQRNSHTSGSIYYRVISKERRGDYLGSTVQVIPHVTDEIKQAITSVEEQNVDVGIVEIGGTVGDIESQPFLEAIRQMRGDLGKDRCLYVHLTLVPYLRAAGEYKTKPTQHSVKELRSLGIQPDIIICRCEEALTADLKRKIALFCDVDADAVFTSADVDNVYKVPLNFYEEGLDQKIAIMLRLPAKNAKLEPWRKLVQTMTNPKGDVTIGIVGKYVELKEAYKSLHEALVHGGVANEVRVNLSYINSEELTRKNCKDHLARLDAVLVPGGFGNRGIEGKIEAIHYARVNKIPFFGICLGLQCAVIEFSRNVAGIADANSEEFNPFAENKVIYLMSEWFDHRKQSVEVRDSVSNKGGTMRLGAYPCQLAPDSLAHSLYGKNSVEERHRHRFEFNKAYKKALEEKGLSFSGMSPDGELAEIIELPEHPWFLGCQFHPEFKSSPMRPHPLFTGFIAAAKKYRAERQSA
ncbi:CTP synthase [Deltaproteobacteria bacterium]|nr:CTP synthase [Deltaproteobacteria bacterium]